MTPEQGTPLEPTFIDLGIYDLCKFSNGEWSLREKLRGDDVSHIRYLDMLERAIANKLVAIQSELTEKNAKLRETEDNYNNLHEHMITEKRCDFLEHIVLLPKLENAEARAEPTPAIAKDSRLDEARRMLKYGIDRATKECIDPSQRPQFNIGTGFAQLLLELLEVS
jgi:hypothetical protein